MELPTTVHPIRAGIAAAWPATLRYALAGLVSAAVVLLLFMLIYGLIAGGRDGGVSAAARVVDYSRRQHDALEPPPRREPPQKPLPPLPAPAFAAVTAPPTIALPPLPIGSDAFAITLPLGSGVPTRLHADLPNALLSDGDVVPLSRNAPQYPHEALVNRTEGWVEIEFTIAVDGTVKDPVVVGAQPSRVFERDALRAISRWKFKPYLVSGVAVERRARQVIEFTLDHGD